MPNLLQESAACLSRGVALMCALALATVALPRPGAAQSSVDYASHTLENGLEIIAVRNGSVPLATVEVAFRNGAFTQVTEPEDGLPHLLEHMLFKGDRGFSGDIAEIDGTYNGTTGDETVTYYATVPSKNVEKAIEVLARLVRDPDFKKRALEDEADVVQGELERRTSNPAALLDFYTRMYLWGDQLRRKNAQGSIFSIQGADTDLLKDHYRKYYVPNNAVLVVAGDIDPDVVFATAEEEFKKWKRGDDPFEDFEAPNIQPLPQDTFFVVNAEASNVTFEISWHGPSATADPEDAAAANLLESIVSDPAGPFQRELVASGHFYALGLSYLDRNHVGPIQITARGLPEAMPAAAQALQAVLDRMAEPGFITEEDLARAREGERFGAALRRESVSGMADAIARRWSTYGLAGVMDPQRYEPTVEDVQAFVRKYMVEGRRAVGLLISENTVMKHEAVLVPAIQGWTR